MSLTGRCRCGKTTFEVPDVDPLFSGFCHCSRCRRSIGTHAVQLIGMPSAEWKITNNADKVLTFVHTDKFHVISCGLCGGPVANLPQGAPFVGVYPTLLDKYSGEFPTLEEKHKPKVHLNYANRLVDSMDSLPKFLDFPSEFGGSGKMFEGEK